MDSAIGHVSHCPLPNTTGISGCQYVVLETSNFPFLKNQHLSINPIYPHLRFYQILSHHLLDLTYITPTPLHLQSFAGIKPV